MVGPVEAEMLAIVGSKCMLAFRTSGEGCNWFASSGGIGGAVSGEMAWCSTAKAMASRLCMYSLAGGRWKIARSSSFGWWE